MRPLLALPILASIAAPALHAQALPGSVYLVSGNRGTYDFRCTAGGRLDRFRAETLEYLGSVDVPAGSCGAAQWSPDGRIFVMGSSGVAAIDPATGHTLLSLPTRLTYAGFALSPDGTVYASSYDSGAGAGLAAFDGTTGERLWWKSYSDGDLQPVDIAVNADGGRVAVALFDGSRPFVRVYDFDSHTAASVPIQSSLPGADAEVGTLAFVRDGLVLAGDPNCDAIYLVDALTPALLDETVQYGRDSGAGDTRMVWDSAGNGGLLADGNRLLFYDLAGVDSHVLVDAGEASIHGLALAPGGTGWVTVAPWYTHDVRIDRIDGTTLAITTNGAAVTIPDPLGLPGDALVYGDSAPALDAPTELSVESGAAISFTVTFGDPDHDPVSLSAGGLPEGATLDLASGVFSWTPDRAALGDHLVVFRATTPGLDAAVTTTIHVVDSRMETVHGGCACDVAGTGGGGGAIAVLALLSALLLARRLAD